MEIKRFEYLKTEYTYIIKGTVLQEDNTPNKSCLVVLYSISGNVEVARVTTNDFGYYEFVYALNALNPALYELRLYGAGSWATTVFPFEIVSSSGPTSAYITSSNGTIFKLSDAGYTPSSTILEVFTQNVVSPTYLWKLNGVSTGVVTKTITPVLATIFLEDDYANYTCTINGETEEGINITEFTVALTLSKIVDGAYGPGIVYRGIYDSSKTYYKTASRRDVVYYSGSYYICNTNETTGSWNASKWDFFENQFSSVATGLLLAEDATITKVLTIGELGSATYGTIRSVGATDLNNGNGFYLSANNTEGLFRVGSSTQFLKWDGTNLRVKSDYFDLTTDGKLWAKRGGFGGTVGTPKIELYDEGLKAGETYLHGNSAWNAPTNVQVNVADIGQTFNLIGFDPVTDISRTATVSANDIGKVFSISVYIEAAGGTTNDVHKGYIYVYFTPTSEAEVLISTNTFYINNGITTKKSVSYYPTEEGAIRFQVAYVNCSSSIGPPMELD